MPRIAVLLLSLMLGAGCAVLVSCGSGDSGPGIPATNAEQILAELERARASEAAGDCAAVAESASKIQANINAIDEPIDPEVMAGVDQGAQHLAELASDPTKCQETSASTTTSTTDQTTSTKPTTSTTATPTTTEETTTTTSTEEQPPGNGPEGTGPPGQPTGPPAPGGTGGTGDGQ